MEFDRTCHAAEEQRPHLKVLAETYGDARKDEEEYARRDAKHLRNTLEKRQFFKPAAQNPTHIPTILGKSTPSYNASLTLGRRCLRRSARASSQ
jgi:hypothetical protein